MCRDGLSGFRLVQESRLIGQLTIFHVPQLTTTRPSLSSDNPMLQFQ